LLRYDFKNKHSSKFTVEMMCEILEITRSRCYYWLKKPESKRDKETKMLTEEGIKSYNEAKGIYGLDKILADVKEKIPKCCLKRLYRIQKKKNLILNGKENIRRQQIQIISYQLQKIS
jgi:putative transposase